MFASVEKEPEVVIRELFDEAERRDPEHLRTWVCLVDGDKAQIRRIRKEAKRRGVTVIELTTAPGDMGKIIGRQGRTAAALRTLVALTAEKHGKRAHLDIRD